MKIYNKYFLEIINLNILYQLNAPFKPELSGKIDVQNFDEEFTSEDVAQSMIPEKNLELIKKNQDKFKEFKQTDQQVNFNYFYFYITYLIKIQYSFQFSL